MMKKCYSRNSNPTIHFRKAAGLALASFLVSSTAVLAMEDIPELQGARASQPAKQSDLEVIDSFASGPELTGRQIKKAFANNMRLATESGEWWFTGERQTHHGRIDDNTLYVATTGAGLNCWRFSCRWAQREIYNQGGKRLLVWGAVDTDSTPNSGELMMSFDVQEIPYLNSLAGSLNEKKSISNTDQYVFKHKYDYFKISQRGVEFINKKSRDPNFKNLKIKWVGPDETGRNRYDIYDENNLKTECFFRMTPVSEKFYKKACEEEFNQK